MFHYFCGIYFKYRKLILPIAMFTDPVKWRKPVSNKLSLTLPELPICDFTYSLIKLKNYKAQEFEAQIDKNPLAAAYLPHTDYPRKERNLIKAKAMQGINNISPGPKRATLFSLIDVSIKLDRDEERQYQELIHSDYQEVKMLQSIEEVGIEKGFQKGIEKGIDQGFQLEKHQASEVIAKNLLPSGKLSNEEIAIVTGMSLKRSVNWR